MVTGKCPVGATRVPPGMKLHADLSQPAAVRGGAVASVPSPMPGVDRRMLERDGGEVNATPPARSARPLAGIWCCMQG